MSTEKKPIGIGSTIWIFDQNRRVYKKEPGQTRSSGGPIYREHWAPAKVVGETRVSWVTDYWGRKVKKKGERWVAFTEQEVDDDCWANSNRCGITRALERAGFNKSPSEYAALLREVAKLIGYKEAK